MYDEEDEILVVETTERSLDDPTQDSSVAATATDQNQMKLDDVSVTSDVLADILDSPAAHRKLTTHSPSLMTKSCPAVVNTDNETDAILDSPPSTPSKKRKSRGKTSGSRPTSSPLLGSRGSHKNAPSPLLSRGNKVSIGSKNKDKVKHNKLKNSEDDDEDDFENDSQKQDSLIVELPPRKSPSPKKKGPKAMLSSVLLPPLKSSMDTNLIMCTAEVHHGKSRTPSAASIDNVNYDESAQEKKVYVGEDHENMPDNLARELTDMTQGIDNPAFSCSDSGYALNAKVTMEMTSDETTF